MSTSRAIRRALAALAMALGTAFWAVGCGSPGQDSAPIEISGLPPMFGDEAAGGGLGPHGGQLIDLGRNSKYRAELVLDAESGRVRLFVLDSQLRESAVVEQKAIVNLFVGGQPRMFELPAATRCSKNRPGSPSVVEFALDDSELVELFRSGQARSCKVRLLIDDKAYTGVMAYNGTVVESRTSRRPGASPR